MTASGATGAALRALRSRRLAVGLLIGLTLYSFAATLVPRGSPDSEPVREWAAAHPVAESLAAPLGMHRAYSSPVFLLLAGLLTLSTVACSWERTTQARRALREMGNSTASAIEQLRTRPRLVLTVRTGVDPAAALTSAADGLRSLGLRVRADAGAAEAAGGRWGALGSPLFHWSLALLMLSAAAGQATRAEGFVGLPLGTAVREEHAGYLQIGEGPLFGERHTGVDMVASDLVYQFVDGEVTRGPAPVITLLRDGAQVASQRVYPNHPLRYGSLMIHMSDYGLAPSFGLEAPDGARIAKETLTLDFSRETSSGTVAQEFSLTSRSGQSAFEVRVEVPVDRGPAGEVLGRVPRSPRALVATAAGETTGFGWPVAVGLGGSVPLPGGQALRLTSLDNWVRVSVANDWSVGFIYLFLVLALLGLSVSLLVPPRRVRLMLLEEDGEARLHATWWHARRDPAFAGAVRAALERAVSSEEASE